MPDIFLSYAREDRDIAARLSSALAEDGWTVFFDRNIQAGAEWSEDLQRALNTARCVIVVWSAASRNSFWVRGEAAHAFEQDTYLPIRVDEASLPRLFRHRQALPMTGWVDHDEDTQLMSLRRAVASRIGELPMHGSLVEVGALDPVTPEHLHLVHSCWRVDRETEFGVMPFQIHLIVYGHRSALDRIESVEYGLPGYPAGHDKQSGGPRERLFELKELANGFSVAQAFVTLRTQPPGHPRVIRLSRLINMSESGPRLNDFIRSAQALA